MTRWIDPDADGVIRFEGHPDEIGRGPSFEIDEALWAELARPLVRRAGSAGAVSDQSPSSDGRSPSGS